MPWWGSVSCPWPCFLLGGMGPKRLPSKSSRLVLLIWTPSFHRAYCSRWCKQMWRCMTYALGIIHCMSLKKSKYVNSKQQPTCQHFSLCCLAAGHVVFVSATLALVCIGSCLCSSLGCLVTYNTVCIYSTFFLHVMHHLHSCLSLTIHLASGMWLHQESLEVLDMVK